MLRLGQENVAKKLFFGDKTNKVIAIQYIECKMFTSINRRKHVHYCRLAVMADYRDACRMFCFTEQREKMTIKQGLVQLVQAT